jgi:trans-aconitate methyltransferase
MAQSPVLPPTALPPNFKPVGKNEDGASWDAYLRRRSDSLTKLHELGHYTLTMGYVFERDEQPVSVLDLGCGDGTLFDLLRHQAHRMKRYLGVDLSSWGVEQARKRWPLPNVDFEVGDLYTWEPKNEDRFDRIVFCESLQYITDPLALLRKYVPYLAEDGRIIASVFELENRRTADFWRDADASFECLDAVTVRNDVHAMTWHVRTMRAR